jgi:hypothetical protein
MTPSLADRLEVARQWCTDAYKHEPLSSVDEFLTQSGVTAHRRAELVGACAAKLAAVPALLTLRDAVRRHVHPDAATCGLERVLLLRTALDNIDRIPSLPVDESVMHLFCRDFKWYADPARVEASMLSCDGYVFYARLRVAMLIRFPNGQSEWEISGIPRSWLLRVSPRDLPRTFRFIFSGLKGYKPLFVAHVGTARRWPFLSEREAHLAFYREALALEKQPQIRGIMAASWLHSRETHRVSPHLAFMNCAASGRHGFYVDLGPSSEKDGFLEGDAQRAELYRTGQYKPTIGLVACTREHALEWMRSNRHLEEHLIPQRI